jgi:hypothetical protein
MSSSQIEELLSSTSISWVIEEMLFTLESAADYEAGRSLTYKMMLEFYRDLTITCLEMSHILADHIIPFVVSTSQQSASFWFCQWMQLSALATVNHMNHIIRTFPINTEPILFPQ